MKNVCYLQMFSRIVMNEAMNITSVQEHQEVWGSSFPSFLPTFLPLFLLRAQWFMCQLLRVNTLLHFTFAIDLYKLRYCTLYYTLLCRMLYTLYRMHRYGLVLGVTSSWLATQDLRTNSMHNSKVQYSAVQYSAVQYSTVQRSTVQHSTVY